MYLYIGSFPFAKCFICQEMGHLARSCPENPRGLYPQGKIIKFLVLRRFLKFHLVNFNNSLYFCIILKYLGGGCKICGSVEHLKRDCPQLVRKKNKGKSRDLQHHIDKILSLHVKLSLYMSGFIEHYCAANAGQFFSLYAHT